MMMNHNFRIVVDFNEKAKISARKMQESGRRKVLAVATRSLISNYATFLPTISRQRADWGWDLQDEDYCLIEKLC